MDDMMTPFVNQCKKEVRSPSKWCLKLIIVVQIYITLTAIILGLIGMALAIAFLVKDEA